MIVEAKGLNKRFANQIIMKDFSFSIETHQVVVLEGRSGTGKTTLLRIINNLESADGGSLSIDGIKLFENGRYVSKEQQREYQKKVGLVFQHYALFPHLNVQENLIIAPTYHQMDQKENLLKKAKELLEELEISNKQTAKISSLSGGERQRVAIARAMMLEPKLLCFDEPTSALDQDSIKHVGRLIKQITKKDIGVFIITHERSFAKEVAHTLLNTSEFRKEER